MNRKHFPLILLVVTLIGCSAEHKNHQKLDGQAVVNSLKNIQCDPIEDGKKIPIAVDIEKVEKKSLELVSIGSFANTQCAQCHQSPNNQGGFTYVDSFAGEMKVIGGKKILVPGYKDTIEAFIKVVDNKTMPPTPTSEEVRLKFLNAMQTWKEKGLPETEVAEAEAQNPYFSGFDPSQFTDMGSCLPLDVGVDKEMDKAFAEAEKLPQFLSQTDLYTFDSKKLAATGTLSYNIQYPLLNLNTLKMRHIRMPGGAQGNSPEPAAYDADKNLIELPEGTRVYKTFFKAIEDLDWGGFRFRPIETRVIVTGEEDDSAKLYGVYVWNEDFTDAELLQQPYRDGTPWKDLVLDVPVPEGWKEQKYAVPARHRCLQCHKGALQGNHVIGMSPLQLNRRKDDKASLSQVRAGSEDQIQHFFKLGVFSGEAKKLQIESFSKSLANKYELKAQGYFVGNCAHCHNENGFAKESGIDLELTLGAAFDFNTHKRSAKFPNLKLVHHEGKLEQSHLYSRVAASKKQLIGFSRMPMHTPEVPDCKAVETVGRWVLSHNPEMSEDKIDGFQFKDCAKEKAFSEPQWYEFIEEDFTESQEEYAPRRGDWQTESGMPGRYWDLKFDAELEKIAKTEFPVNWWRTKDGDKVCEFPEKTKEDIPEEMRYSWMFKRDGEPKKNLGELYWNTPGALFYAQTCTKCHGRHGLGDGQQASALARFSGNAITVANFRDGMFSNLSLFDSNRSGRNENYSGQYLIWMAMEGTLMKIPSGAGVPPVLADLLGKHKAKMLKQVQDRCEQLIPGHPRELSKYTKWRPLLEMVCTHDNWPVDDPRLEFERFEDGSRAPKNPEEMAKWLDKAAVNAGWTIFAYLRDRIAKNNPQVQRRKCSEVFPTK